MSRRGKTLDPDLPKGVYVSPVPGITAQIISQDKKAFPNYPSPDKESIAEDEALSEYFNSRTITTYIAVTNDTPFSIHLRVDRPYPMKMDCSKLQFEIFIDGKFVWNAWCYRPRYEENGNVWEDIIGGMKLGKGGSCEIKDFKFMRLKTNDECPSYTACQRIRESMEKIGNIEIKVFRTAHGKKGGDVKNSKKGFLNKDNIEVPEKALKGAEAKSHGTARDEKQAEGMFGETPRNMVNIQSSSFALCTALKVCILQANGVELVTDQNTLHAEALKSLHVINRTPTPSRSSSPDSDHHGGGNLTASQAKQIEDLLKSFREGAGGGGGSSSRKRIKRENDEAESSQRPEKRRRAGGKAVTIDLTGDSSEDEERN
ncbi:hypothetical protein DSL72_004113 [Monilinia vaccinii-corymbosi]|uniref:DUF7918 domain-containing protein n=1 Tax=Monilinia vaccinii-corymbosi TaxID=61207 RepID=A0A8A3P9L6_9HELO|nr:hypothetical protein DSL72_004113 [Monilinia vaccinii-corymbosi]